MRLPLAPWLAGYRRDWLGADVVAGLTTSAIVIPKAMAYAVIAGLPVEAGLYTALAAMLAYPLLGTSRPLSVSTTSALAMLTATQVARFGGADGPAAVAATLTLLVGGVLLAARLLRLGFLANFISKPVLVGFQAGVGVVILVGQLPSALGIHATGATTLGMLAELPGLLPQAHVPTLLVALAGIAVLFVLERAAPRLPASLVWVAASVALSVALGLETMGVRTVGAVPAGLPALSMPDLALAGALAPAALGVGLMAFTESVAAARAFRARGDVSIDANRELVAVGAANVASAFAGGFPAGGGTSQTAVADASGAKSQLAQWVNAGAVLICLLFLSGAIAQLPQPALAAVILVAAVSMIRPQDFRAIHRFRRTEFAWALVTLAGVIVLGTLEGILVAVVVSILTLMYQANHPAVYAIAYNRAKDVFRRAGEHAGDEATPGLLVVRAEGRLTFANAANVSEKMRLLVEQTQPRVLVLECSAIPDIEYTALVMLTEAEQDLRRHRVSLWLAALNPDLLRTIERAPLGAALGHERMFITAHHALEAFRRGGNEPPTLEGEPDAADRA